MRSLFYNIRKGVSNLYHWFKIIWSDRNFDPIYFYKITDHKLNMMINSFEKKSYAVNSWYQIQYMKKARNILKKIIENDFVPSEEFQKYLPKILKLEDWNEVPEESLKCIQELQKKEDELRKKHVRLFFLILEKRVQHWWD